jgi:hypothetical protein
MSFRPLAILVVPFYVAVALSASGCRMADGPLPTPGSEDLNRLDDLRRDLGNVVGGHAEAKQDFIDDLRVFVKPGTKPQAPPAINELARLVTDAAVAAQLKEPAMPPLLRQVWTAVVARDLSERQIATLQADVKTTLAGLAVPEPSAQAIASQIVVVQKAVTDRERRWYEVF